MPRLLALLALLVAPLWAHDAAWPEVTQNHRPLVRWWWPADLSPSSEPGPELESMARAGFGAVEILPYPPARGGPPSELEWLAPAWVKRYALASEAAASLGLRLDLSCNGPAPGNLPAISPYESAFRSVPILAKARGGLFELALPPGSIDCLGAWPPHGPPVDLRPFIDLSTQSLTWQAPPGTWNIYGIGRDPANYPDHFSTNTASQSLARYAEAFIDPTAPFPRAYSLSFSELDADWSSALIPAFQRRRGYDLREQLPALYGDSDAGTVERVLSDYRETLADLRRDTLITWHQWANDQGSLSRSQIKGIFGNPIDLQGVPDIPGVIVSGIPTDDDLPLLAFAASAAHLHTKPLIAATLLHETKDPERITPSQMKECVDLLWLAGANQTQLDGMLSGPATDRLRAVPDTPFTPLGPGSGRGENIASFNAYITRCQSILQSGAPDPEVLIYYPFHDLLTERGGIPADPAKQNDWFRPTSFHRTARTLLENGIPCDYVSDLLLENAAVSHGKIMLGGLTYKTLIIPEVRRLPENTARQLLALSRRGASITILGDWPRDVPGFPMPDIRRGTLFTTLQDIPESQILEGDELLDLLTEAGVQAEPMSQLGLRFVRRSHREGHHYFIVNRSSNPVDAWVTLATPATSAILMDPRFLKRSGITPIRQHEERSQVRLILEPGESRILRTFTHREAEGPEWTELTPSGNIRTIGGTWKVQFTEGGPELPDEFEAPILGSWTTLSDPRAVRFSGTARYSINFEIPTEGKWLLDLGQLAHTAQVFINGNDAGSAYTPPHQFDLSRFLRQGTNSLDIDVTNLPQPGPESDRPPSPSGLLGPVRLIPLTSQ